MKVQEYFLAGVAVSALAIFPVASRAQVTADAPAVRPPNMTYDLEPHAGAADFDDSTWEALRPAQLEERRSTGRLCFNWYRIAVTIPEKIGSFDPTGGGGRHQWASVQSARELYLGQVGHPRVLHDALGRRAAVRQDRDSQSRPGVG